MRFQRPEFTRSRGVFSASVIAALLLLGFVFRGPRTPIAQAGNSNPKAGTIQAGVRPTVASQAHLAATYASLPLSFEANRGQSDAQVQFLSRGSGYTMFLTGNEAVLALRNRPMAAGRLRSAHQAKRDAAALRSGLKASLFQFLELPQRESSMFSPEEPLEDKTASVIQGDVVRMKLVGANAAPKASGL
jgi:hypothetical protein